MRFIDISVSLDKNTIAWPGDVKFDRKESRGSGITSKLTMSTHTGTHVDAPRHFIFSGPGVDRIALSKLVGPARVIHIPYQVSSITDEVIRKYKIKKGERILFKTRNSALLKKKKFTSDYVSLSLEAAKYLVKKKINLVGIDYLGIEAKSSPGHPVHKTLLRAGIVNVEGLNLSGVKPGRYNLAVLPLRLKDSDGSPARAVLWK